MKTTAIILIILISCSVVSGNPLDSVFTKGNSFYQQKNYSDAIKCYETIENCGKESSSLYFNLANAYFKTNDQAKAILYYEKALKLNPGDQDALYNLSIANSRITDKINVLPEIFFITWFKNARNSMSSDTWSLLTAIVFVSLLITILGFLLLQSIVLRRISATIAILSLFGFVVFIVFAISAHIARTDNSNAVIMSPSVVVKSSPDESATDLFVVHEGTKVKILENFENWSEVQISDGNRGWVVAENYEVI